MKPTLDLAPKVLGQVQRHRAGHSELDAHPAPPPTEARADVRAAAWKWRAGKPTARGCSPSIRRGVSKRPPRRAATSEPGHRGSTRCEGSRNDQGKLPLPGDSLRGRAGDVLRSLSLLDVPEGARRRIRDVRRRPRRGRSGSSTEKTWSSSTNPRPAAIARSVPSAGRTPRRNRPTTRWSSFPPDSSTMTRVVRPTIHMFVDSKAPWWEINDDLPKFKEYPTE